MSYGLLLGEDQRIAAWAYATFNIFALPINRALGVVDETGTLKGAILFQNFNGINIELSYYGPNTLTPGIARAIARIVVTEFNAARLTVVTSKKNKRLIRALSKIGFSIEGQQRCFYGHRDCNRNTGVRLVAFYERICKVAGVPCVPLNQSGHRPCFSLPLPVTTQTQ